MLRILAPALIAAAIAGCSANLAPFTPEAARTAASAGAPISADGRSRVVILEYEAWFGPNAVTFQNAEAMPVLQSRDMQRVGGGYDSADPHVISQHVAWMQYMGIDAASVDVTNNVGCIFSTGPVSREFCNPASEQFRSQNRQILLNTGNLYPAWTRLRTSLKIVPLLGCQTWLDLRPGSGGKSGFQKEVEYFGHLMATYPMLDVRYLGRPLMWVYVGTPVNVNILGGCKAVLRKAGLDDQYTFRIAAGYLDSQPAFWAHPREQPDGPIEIAPRYGFWSVVDRYKPSYHLFPTYTPGAGGFSGAENLTVSVATSGQTGWGCPQPAYCLDDALRYEGATVKYGTLDAFMALAAQLRPRFLIVDQFNEFAQPDEGWDAQTSDDTEPTRLPHGWGYTGIQAVHDALAAYRW